LEVAAIATSKESSLKSLPAFIFYDVTGSPNLWLLAAEATARALLHIHSEAASLGKINFATSKSSYKYTSAGSALYRLQQKQQNSTFAGSEIYVAYLVVL
jgi:hypothetical protein